ncbi:MAG: bifunctional indole-3-glycerol-phosphate synthase TrpC/phosphoribosylanthranilate isomerase TrpF [Terriglobales bacterium]
MARAGTAGQAPLPTILDKIVTRRREQVAAAARAVSAQRLRQEWRARPHDARDFAAALRQARRPAIIAELKRASPSRGRMREDFDVAALAQAYEAAGATALSVLTEEDHFEGRLEYLRLARDATRLPVLRKDFIFDTYQIWEAAWAGADAVLLIAAMLDDSSLKTLSRAAKSAGLTTLVEVHDARELERALAVDAGCIGVNHRDLRTFEVNLDLGRELGARLPPGALGVAESGLHTGADLARMAAAGFQAFLIGEQFMRAPDPGAALRALLAQCHLPFLKICGLTNREDALQACEAGAHAVGFVFAASSPRRALVEQVRNFAPSLPAEVARVGVFAGAPPAEIRAVAHACGLHAVQLHGAYLPGDAQQLAREVAVWRAVAMPHGLKAALAWAPFVERFVLDTPGRDGVSGGSGATFDWSLAREFATQLPTPRPKLLIAGGLTPDNVGTALRQSLADGADVASGVEFSPGHKSHGKVTTFCRSARLAFRGDD